MTQEEFFKRYTYSPSRDRIGGGGFGTVYKAYDNLLHREVAIKVSEVKTTADGAKTFSLRDEFEALNHVPKHPNIANYEEFYSFEMPNGVFDYAVMQYYPDGNLSNAIKQVLTAEQKEDIATQLLEGIDFLHRHKVVHRDLKPGNILIVKHGGRIIPLITDFGLSKATGMGENSVFSNSFGAGTPKYSSPEQLQGNPLRLNTDLWSYGAIIYELFTGEQLFNASSGAANTAQADIEVYNKIVNGKVQSLGKMPEKWRKVAERCLVVDAAKRAKDAGELFAIIKGDDDETIGSSSGSGTTTGPKMPTNTPPIDKPSPKDPHSGTSPFKGVGGIQDPLSPTPNDKPTNKKGLWIGLGIAAAVIVALLLLLKPKQEPIPADPDTQAYEACQTVADYRAYISDYGQNSLYYADAKAFVDQYVADSIERVQDSLARVQAQEQAKAEQIAQAKAEKKEDDAYKKCTTIAGCNNYLKEYPEGRYVEEVKTTKAELEQTEAEKKEEAAYKKCTTIESCDAYLKNYPEGKYVEVVKTKRKELQEAKSNEEEEETQNHRPSITYPVYSGPKGDLVCTFYFAKDNFNANNSSYNKTADNVIREKLSEGYRDFRVIAWIVPGEMEGHEKELANNRANAVEKQIQKIAKKTNINTQIITTGIDMAKIIGIISETGIRDKEAILNQLQKSSDKEETFQFLSDIYPELERDILPTLRRVEVYVY